MDNCQLNAITGYYKIPVTLYQEAGTEQKKKNCIYIYTAPDFWEISCPISNISKQTQQTEKHLRKELRRDSLNNVFVFIKFTVVFFYVFHPAVL